MTRRQAREAIELLLQDYDSRIPPEDILIALDEALDFEPEIAEMSATCKAKAGVH